MRDNFNSTTRRKLAARAGNVCSNPDCRTATEGAALGGDGFVVVGIAAHITAASAGGPRYDSTLTSAERKHESNGIWCCEIHGKQIDSDEAHFTVEKLREWKQAAIKASAHAILTLQRQPKLSAGGEPLEDEEREQVAQLSLQAQDDLVSVTARLRVAARNDIAAFRRALKVPHDALALNLKLRDGENSTAFEVNGLASAITTFNEITIVAPPGTGKTTTLVQAVEAMLNRDDLVATFVPLSEWSAQPESMLHSITRRIAFAGMTPGHLKLLTIHGRLILVLDGWNELDVAARKRARGEVTALLRDFPLLCILMSTRRQALDVPLAGPTVEIDALTEDQQLCMARALRGTVGESILDHAWRTAGVRDLVAIPLYLTAVLAHAVGDRLPTTKEEVLRLFIFEHERVVEKAEALYAVTLGFHAEMLTALAVDATKCSNATIPDVRARAAIRSTEVRLFADGQIGSTPEPTSILDTLVNHHVLVRSGPLGAGVTFQHQQFQEFYAGAEVETLMRLSASGDQQARKRLRIGVLNEHTWEESILFACERMSRGDAIGIDAVARAIYEALAIDPMLAAEMIYRSSDQLWECVKSTVIEFAANWHKAGNIDRAVRFMINTGRGEFSAYVWPLISNPDDQVHLHALRAGRRFRVSVLGADAERSIRGLKEELREHILSEIILNGGFEGIDFVTRVAQADPSPVVQASVVESLLFRRAQRQSQRVLDNAPEKVWELLAHKGFAAEEISDSATAERLQREHQQYMEADKNVARRLRTEVRDGRHKRDRAGHVQALIESAEFPVGDRDAGWEINEAHQLYPREVQVALVSRLERGLAIPHSAAELLVGASLNIESGPINELVLDAGADKHVAAAAACLVGTATVGRLIDAFLAIGRQRAVEPGRSDRGLSDESMRLSGLIAKTHPEAFGNAILNRVAIAEPVDIAGVADLFGRHGVDHERKVLAFLPETRAKLIAAVQSWVEILLSSPNVRRAELAEMASAIERLAAPELLSDLTRMLTRDLALWRRAREVAAEARSAGRQSDSDAHMAWTLQYRRAFVKIGGAHVIDVMKTYLPDGGHGTFGVDAAYVLYEIWGRDQ